MSYSRISKKNSSENGDLKEHNKILLLNMKIRRLGDDKEEGSSKEQGKSKSLKLVLCIKALFKSIKSENRVRFEKENEELQEKFT